MDLYDIFFVFAPRVAVIHPQEPTYPQTLQSRHKSLSLSICLSLSLYVFSTTDRVPEHCLFASIRITFAKRCNFFFVHPLLQVARTSPSLMPNATVSRSLQRLLCSLRLLSPSVRPSFRVSLTIIAFDYYSIVFFVLSSLLSSFAFCLVVCLPLFFFLGVVRLPWLLLCVCVCVRVLCFFLACFCVFRGT